MFFFFNDTATTEIYTLSLHDALPISRCQCRTRPNHRNVLSYQSRPHCQLKYWNHIPICAPSDACRSHTGGLPYCWRVSTSHSVFHVVGSPSLIGGECAPRVGGDR